jgi:hypothetical protein
MKKNGSNCINCSGKMHLKSVLLTWKRRVVENKEMVSFGKYKGILTYKQLCDDTFKKKYVDWCINESVMNDGLREERLRYFADKCRDFIDKSDYGAFFWTFYRKIYGKYTVNIR